MQFSIDLTPFERKTLEGLMATRIQAQREEREFIEIVFRSHGNVAPNDIQKEGNKLTWVGKEIEPAAV